jgi:hypothetical protein
MWKYAVRASNHCRCVSEWASGWPGAPEAAQANHAMKAPSARRFITAITLEYDSRVVTRDQAMPGYNGSFL